MNVFKWWTKHDRDIEHPHQACTTNQPSTIGDFLAQSRRDITQLHFKKMSSYVLDWTTPMCTINRAVKETIRIAHSYLDGSDGVLCH